MTPYTLPTGTTIDLDTQTGVQAGHDYLATVLASATDPNIQATINGLLGAYTLVPTGNYPNPSSAYASILDGLQSLPPVIGPKLPPTMAFDPSTILLVAVGAYLVWRMFK